MVIYQNDHLGTPQKLTAVNGAVGWSAKYSSFGAAQVDPSSIITNNLRFAGQYFDQETYLQYNWHRYYSPATGRYLRIDPVGLDGGDENFYSYVWNNPNYFIDFNGLAPIGVSEEEIRESFGLPPSYKPDMMDAVLMGLAAACPQAFLPLYVSNTASKFSKGIRPLEGRRITQSIRNSLKVRGRNVAIAEVVINGKRKLYAAVSGKASPAGTVNKPTKRIFKTRPSGAMPRKNDTEVKILEEIAEGLSKKSKGKISIYTERAPCFSCQGVIEQFKKRFPDIELIVTYIAVQNNLKIKYCL